MKKNNIDDPYLDMGVRINSMIIMGINHYDDQIPYRYDSRDPPQSHNYSGFQFPHHSGNRLTRGI